MSDPFADARAALDRLEEQERRRSQQPPTPPGLTERELVQSQAPVRVATPEEAYAAQQRVQAEAFLAQIKQKTGGWVSTPLMSDDR
jgi:hypothetical protein